MPDHPPHVGGAITESKNVSACHRREGRLHGLYPYLFWRQDGRLKKIYVRRQDLAAVRQAIARRQAR